MPVIVNKISKETLGQSALTCPPKEIIKVYAGVFSFKYVYYILHEWFLENGYCPTEEQKFPEAMYGQRDSAAGKEIFIRWRLKKATDDYYYTEYQLDLIMHCLALSETEVLVGGKKMKMDKGEVEFKFNGRILQNPKVDASWYMQNKRLKKWFTAKHLFDKRNYHFENFLTEFEQLQEFIKEHFGIERYLENREILEYYKSRMGE